jgi:hypothetical protein
MAGLSSDRSERMKNSLPKGTSRSTISGIGDGDWDTDRSGMLLSLGLPSGMGSSSSISSAGAGDEAALDRDCVAAILISIRPSSHVRGLDRGELAKEGGRELADDGFGIQMIIAV